VEADEACIKAIGAFRAAARRQELAPVYVTRAEAACVRGDAASALEFCGEALTARMLGEDATIRATVGLDAAAVLLRLDAREAPEAEEEAKAAASDSVALLHQRDYRFLLRTKAASFAQLREPMRRWGLGTSLFAAGPAPSSLRIELLGGLRVFFGSEPLKGDAWKRRRARDIFAYLVSLGGRAVPRSRLVDLYWPETEADAAHDNLRVTVSAIRRAVGDVVRFESNGYHFAAPPNTYVDVEVFDAHVDAARHALVRGDAAEALSRYTAAAELYGGEFLEGMDDGNWQWRERDRLRAAYLEALRAVAANAGSAGATRRGAIDRILEAAPFDLEAVRMRLADLLGEARAGEARREFEQWQARYRATVGTEPPDVWPQGSFPGP
jgi:DNA-binding SARP family transcriptional activator